MLRKHQLEEERERVHQAVGKVLAVLNYDTTDVSCYSSILILGCGVLTVRLLLCSLWSSAELPSRAIPGPLISP